MKKLKKRKIDKQRLAVWTAIILFTINFWYWFIKIIFN